MKTFYPIYRGKKVIDIRLCLQPKDEKFLDDFLNYCRITAGAKKIKNIERIMLQIYDVMGNSYFFDLEKLRRFLALLNHSDKLISTQNDIKKILKRFIKWHYKDWNKKFAELKDIKITDGRNHDKVNPHTLLTDKELEILIRAAENLRFKAMLILMFESAGRPEEILKLRWRDVDLVKGSVKLQSSKNNGRVRVNPIKDSIIHLKRYKQEYPFSNVRAGDLVFPSPRDRDKPISHQAVYNYFKFLEKSIGKNLFPYLLRHTRLTPLHQKLSAKAYEKFADHSIDTAIRYYSHLSNDDVREEMFEKIFQIEEISEEDISKIEDLKNEIRELKKTAGVQQNGINGLLKENHKIWRWLEKLVYINKTVLKLTSEDDDLVVGLKKELEKT
jgi:integrase